MLWENVLYSTVMSVSIAILPLALPRPLGTLGFVAAWLVPWRPAFRTTAAESKLKFFAHHRDAIGRHIAKYGTHEPLVTRWMAEKPNEFAGALLYLWPKVTGKI